MEHLFEISLVINLILGLSLFFSFSRIKNLSNRLKVERALRESNENLKKENESSYYKISDFNLKDL
ncbi:hypothetical protein JJB67_15685 [Clostridium perfringens]|uniref:hypothetical protein n=1 Tax=Clostridium perfringens TaxID=1502 RepID=UPI001ABACF20|nr:hypothetical protein [Clostridium perfringens]MBO3323643.1 hypothetical protein [Clostridium perfringens]MBO3332876.1 hypothetical protein [Clostridium perfringens]